MKQKTVTGNLDQERDTKLIKEWRKRKALQTSKEIGINILCGMINGLSMYGKVAPTVFLSAPPPVSPEHFNISKKY